MKKVMSSKQLTLNNAHETMSKYSQSNNPNVSKISISELSNTHEYSHLMERMNLRQ